MPRSREEIIERLKHYMVQETHWRERAVEFGEQESLVQMRVARGQAEAMAWVLEDMTETQEAGIEVELIDGPYGGAKPTLASQPPTILVGESTYARIDDPDTGESLNSYAFVYDHD